MRSTFTPTSENLYTYGHTRSSKFFGKSHVVQLLVLLCIQLCSQSLFSQVAPLPVERTFSSSPSKFNIDGYLQRQSAGAGDWLEGLALPGNNVLQSNGDPAKPLAYHITDLYTSSDKIFDGSNRATDPSFSSWKWKTGAPSNKANLNHALCYVAKDNAGDTWGMFSADRLFASGTTSIDFEFLQARLDMTNENGTSGSFTGTRTAGDLIVSVQFTGNSSNPAAILFYRWSGSTYELINILSSEGFAKTNNNFDVNVPYLAFGSNTYTSNQFIEGAINISKLISKSSNDNACIGYDFRTLLVKSKTNSDIAGLLDDFAKPIQFNPELSINSATISYASPFCQVLSQTASWQDVTFGQNSITDGTFSYVANAGSPADGLLLNTTNGKIDIANSKPGSYTVTFTYNPGSACTTSATTSATVVIKPQLQVPEVQTTSAQCGSNGSITISNFVTGATYTLSQSGITKYTTTTNSFGTVLPGNYVLEVTKAGSCSSSANIVVSNNSDLTVAVITGTKSVCVGYTTTLNDATENGVWSTENASIATVDPTSGVVTGVAAGNVNIRYTVTSGDCSNFAVTEVTVNGVPTVDILGAFDPICQEQTLTHLGGSIGGTATGGTWSDGGVHGTFTPNTTTLDANWTPPGDFTGQATLTLTTSGGSCTAASTYRNIQVNAIPAKPAVSGENSVCQGSTITLSSSSATNNQWFKDGNPITDAISQTYIVSEAGDYSVEVTNSSNCATRSDAHTVTVGADGSISLSSASGTDAQTPCVNTNITAITYAIGGTATGASLSGTLPSGVSGSYAGGVFTISGKPTQSGTFNYTVTTTGSSCANPHLDGSITVGADGSISLSSASGTDAQTPCVNTNITAITYAIGGTATGASLSGTLPSGVSGSYAGGVFTISGKPTQSGTFNYTVTTTGSSCANPHLDGSITVGADGSISLSSASGTDAQTPCVNTNITAITYAIGGTATGASLSGTLPSGVSGSYAGGVFTISGKPTQSGTFNYTVTTTGSSCANPHLDGSITVGADGTISLSSASGTDAQTPCVNTNITAITYAIGGTATGASLSGTLPTGVSGSYSGGVFTISGKPTQSGTFNYTVTTTGSSCANPHLDGSITVGADGSISLSSASGTDAQTPCVNTNITAITYAIGGTATGASLSGTLPSGVSGSYAGGVFTISGKPTQSGTFNYTVTTTGSSCANPHLDGSITVGADGSISLSSASGTDAQTPCVNTNITAITYAIGGTATGASLSGTLPSGVSGSYAGGVFTISGKPTQSGTFNYTVTTTGSSCANPHLDGSITVGADGTISLSSASGTDAQTPCVNTNITAITYAIGGTATGASLSGTLPTGVSGSYSGGVFTISGKPTQSSTFNYTVTTTGSSCANPHLDGSITVGADGSISLSSASGTDAQTPCVNTNITAITYAIGGTATGASLSGTLPSGVSGSYAGGVFTISGKPTQSGTFNYTVTTTGSSCANPHLDGSITVKRNVLCSSYSGDYFANTGLTTAGGSATVTVAWSVSSSPNPPNVCNSMSGLALSDFIVTPSKDASVTDVSLVNGSATFINGIYSAKYTISLKSTEFSGTVIFNLGTNTNSNYEISSNCVDNPIVTVSSKSDGFVTGGGFVIPTNAGGSLATPVNGINPINGLKNNFGFNMKYNKAGKLQGNWNTIIRRNEGGKIVVYQVKSNVASTLIVTKIDDKRMRADLTYTSANFQNLTCSLCPLDANNGTVVVTVFDNGEPGAGVDSILISIRDRSNNQWYTSHAPGSHSSINADVQLIQQGNIQIHTLGGTKTARIAADQSVTEVQPFNLHALPNPSSSTFNLQLTSSNKIDKMSIRVTDIAGRTVQVLHELAPNQTLNIGSNYRPGLYMVELVQGNDRKQIKLIKL